MGVLDILRSSRRPKPKEKTAKFVLLYEPSPTEQIKVGYLSYAGGVWTFRYAEEYKKRGDLRPIEGFDERQQIYRSTVLFPFFAVRIPDTARHDVRRRLKQDHLKDPDLIDMLRLFGRRVLSSPAFELVPV